MYFWKTIDKLSILIEFNKVILFIVSPNTSGTSVNDPMQQDKFNVNQKKKKKKHCQQIFCTTIVIYCYKIRVCLLTYLYQLILVCII